MSCKAYVTVTVKLSIIKVKDISTHDVMTELDYSFSDTTGKACVIESKMIDFNIDDEK